MGPLKGHTVNITICTNTVLPIFACGCKAWSPALRKYHMLRFVHSRVLAKVFRPRRRLQKFFFFFLSSSFFFRARQQMHPDARQP
jgi:hypothetical protein